MNILLTGSDGFTGRHFADLAKSKGHRVLPLTADLTDREAVHRQVQETAPDAVVHLAAISFVGHSDDNAFYAVNVIGTTNLLAALVQVPQTPRRVLLASSANVYGNCDASPIAETQAPGPVNHYAMSKLGMEYMSRNYADRLPLIITRPFNYTGPGQAANFVIPKLVEHFARRAPAIELGNLDVEREFNDVQTVCSAYLHLLDCGVSGETYNICSGRPYALGHVIDAMTRITGHTIEVVVNPAFVRANDVHRLCGNPGKLLMLLKQQGKVLHAPLLEDTLKRMLTAELRPSHQNYGATS